MRIFSNWRAIVVERERLTYGSWEEKRRGFVFILYSHAKTMGVLFVCKIDIQLTWTSSETNRITRLGTIFVAGTTMKHIIIRIDLNAFSYEAKQYISRMHTREADCIEQEIDGAASR